MSGFVDGHVASGTPHLYVTGETPAAIEQMRVGLVDVANSAAAGFGNVDVAEIMVYDKALTIQVCVCACMFMYVCVSVCVCVY